MTPKDRRVLADMLRERLPDGWLVQMRTGEPFAVVAKHSKVSGALWSIGVKLDRTVVGTALEIEGQDTGRRVLGPYTGRGWREHLVDAIVATVVSIHHRPSDQRGRPPMNLDVLIAAAKLPKHGSSIAPPISMTRWYADHPDDWQGWVEYEDRWIAERKAEHAKRGGLAGKEARWHRADGWARYLVVSEEPLVLVHLDVGDGWRIEPALLRGLTLDDVRRRIAEDP